MSTAIELPGQGIEPAQEPRGMRELIPPGNPEGLNWESAPGVRHFAQANRDGITHKVYTQRLIAEPEGDHQSVHNRCHVFRDLATGEYSFEDLGPSEFQQAVHAARGVLAIVGGVVVAHKVYRWYRGSK